MPVAGATRGLIQCSASKWTTTQLDSWALEHRPKRRQTEEAWEMVFTVDKTSHILVEEVFDSIGTMRPCLD